MPSATPRTILATGLGVKAIYPVICIIRNRVVKHLDGAVLKDHPGYRYLRGRIKQEGNWGIFTGKSPGNAKSGG
jgi:hypothetical protein